MKRFLVVLVLVITTGVLAPLPTAPPASAAAPPQVLAFANVIGSLFQRNRVYRNAAEVQDEIRAYYDGLIDTAREALRGRDLSKLDNQLAAYVRLIHTLETEKQAALELIEADKRGARQAFQSNLNRQLPSLLLTIPAVRELAQTVRTDLGELRGALEATRTAIVEGRPDALLDIARQRAEIDRIAAIAGTIGGRRGEELAEAIGRLGSRLERIEDTAGAVTDEVESGIADADEQLAVAIERLDEQLASTVRPVSVSLFGGLGEVRVPDDYALYAAIGQALSASGSRTHGTTRDAMRDRVRELLVTTRGEHISNLRDCVRATAAQLRTQLAGGPAPQGSAAALLLATDLRTCDPEAIETVLLLAADLESTTTTAPPGEEPPGPAEEPGLLSGGSVHQITTASPGMQVGNGGRLCLDYTDRQPEQLPLPLTACTDDPDFDVVFDFSAGTVAGSLELDLSCPGFDRCWPEDSVVGSVSGTFGPLVFGQEPLTAPDDFPFPDHHYYGDDSYWWAGGPIELDVSISGDHVVGDGVMTGSAATTITGWVDITITPQVYSTGEPIPGWWSNFGVFLDFPQDVNPNWYLYAGFSVDIPETAVDLPPWKEH